MNTSSSPAQSTITRILITFALVLAVASIAAAQSGPLPCKALTQDRTITFCYPIDDANVGTDEVLLWGVVKDSLPHTNTLFLDGQQPGDQVGDDLQGIFSSSPYDDKLHTYTLVVKDAKGNFQKSASFRQSTQLPCSVPSSDRSVNLCIPSAGEITTSPLRVAAVATSSVGISWLQIWVDGVKYWTAHNSGTANQKIMNSHVYLANGTHQVSVVAKEGDGTSIKKTVTVQVVSQP
jgi:hypothetical protein